MTLALADVEKTSNIIKLYQPKTLAGVKRNEVNSLTIDMS